MIEIENSIHQIVATRPFRPFVIELSSGTEIRVDPPEAIVVRGRRAVFIGRDENIIIDADKVAHIRTRGNGASPRH